MLSTLKQVLSSVVDYAGLFPPAQLSLPDAMACYARAQSSPYRGLVGRFVLSASCLPAFKTLFPTFFQSDHGDRGSLSVILSQNWAAELDHVCQLRAATERVVIGALEVAPLPPNDIQTLCDQLPVDMTAFFEIPWSTDLEPYLLPLQQTGMAAKLRTGGVTREAFPDSAQLGRRLLSLAKAKIPFKATAGLHHPLRGNHHLTYEPDSAVMTMHGFLNVALLAAFAYQHSFTLDEAIALLEEQSIHPFQFTEAAICWRDYSLSCAELEQSRQQFFHSFGSCSVQEPIDDLHRLNLL